jgi:hypothetical protein
MKLLPSAALGFVVVGGIEVDGAESLEDAEFLAMCYVFDESSRDRLFPGLVATKAAGLLDKAGEGGLAGHVRLLHIVLLFGRRDDFSGSAASRRA